MTLDSLLKPRRSTRDFHFWLCLFPHSNLLALPFSCEFHFDANTTVSRLSHFAANTILFSVKILCNFEIPSLTVLAVRPLHLVWYAVSPFEWQTLFLEAQALFANLANLRSNLTKSVFNSDARPPIACSTGVLTLRGPFTVRDPRLFFGCVRGRTCEGWKPSSFDDYSFKSLQSLLVRFW